MPTRTGAPSSVETRAHPRPTTSYEIHGTPHLDRPEVTRLLDVAAPVIELTAGPGFGKTTALRQWIDTGLPRTTTTVWHDVASQDTTVEEFWSGLLAQFHRSGALPPVRRAPSLPAPRCAEVLVRALQERSGQIVLVVDNHHRTEPTVDRQLMRLAETVPGLRLVLCMQDSRNLWLDDSQENLVRRIAGETLLFSTEEIAALARHHGHVVDGATAELLDAETGGWPGLVQAVLPALAQPTDSQDRSLELRSRASAYVGERVIEGLVANPDFTWLTKIAVPRGFGVRTARHLIGGGDVLQLLDHGVRSGWLRVQVDSRGRLYRMPAALRRQLVEWAGHHDPQGLRRARQALIGWYADHGRHEAALDLAMELGDWQRALEIAEGGWATLLIRRRTTLQGLFDQVEDRQIARHPRVALVRSILSGQPAEVGALPPATPVSSLGDPGSRTYQSLDLGLARLLSLRVSRRTTEAQGAASDLLPVARQARKISGGQSDPLRLGANLYAGMTLLLSGELAEAEGALQAVAETGVPRETGFLARHAACLLALAASLRGDLDTAQGWIVESERAATEDLDPLSRAAADLDPLPSAAVAVAALLLAVARLDRETAETAREVVLAPPGPHDEVWFLREYALAQWDVVWGDRVAALNRLAQARNRDADRLAHPFIHQVLLAAQVELLLSLGRGDRAAALLRSANPSAPLLAGPSARLTLLTGDPSTAFVNATRGLSLLDDWPRATAELAAIRLAALVELHEGCQAESEARIWRELHGQMLYAAAWMPERHLTTAGTPSLLVIRRDLTDKGVLGRGAAELSLVQLTGREEVVLHRIAEGLTVEQTAAELFVSANTVKTQLRSVYRKLGVSTRTRAVIRAMQLGLIATDET